MSEPRLPETLSICSEERLLYSNVRKVNWQVVECDAMVQCLDFVEQAGTQERQTRRRERER